MQMAKEYSQGPADEDGGDLGYIKLKSFAIKQLANEVSKLSKGQITGVVESDRGLHIAKLLDIRESFDTSLSEVEPKIQKILQEKKMEEEIGGYIQSRRKSSYVKILIK